MENLLQRTQDLERLLLCRQRLALPGLRSERLEGDAEEDEEKGHRLVAVVDISPLGAAACVVRRRQLLSIKSVKHKIAVLLDQAGDGVHQLQPRVLVEF